MARGGKRNRNGVVSSQVKSSLVRTLHIGRDTKRPGSRRAREPKGVGPVDPPPSPRSKTKCDLRHMQALSPFISSGARTALPPAGSERRREFGQNRRSKSGLNRRSKFGLNRRGKLGDAPMCPTSPQHRLTTAAQQTRLPKTPTRSGLLQCPANSHPWSS